VLLRSHDKPREAVVVNATYWDNPWFPDVLREEMEYDKRRDPDRYAHVWLGEYQSASQARVFTNWRVEEFETPDNARFYFGADWGFSVDPTVLVRCFIEGRTLFVDYEAWKVGCDIDYTPALFAGSNDRWNNPFGFEGIPGAYRWNITADSSNPQAISYLQRHGFTVTPSIKGAGSVEEGIEFLKSYDIVVHPRCPHTIDELQNYSWEIDKRTEEILPKLADKKNHLIDSIRYSIEDARQSSYVSDLSWVG
jgi:phage terminase large subunit